MFGFLHKYLKKTFRFQLILILTFCNFSIAALAQESTTNSIKLDIWYVNSQGQTWENKKVAPNRWEQTDTELIPDSVIRYSWLGTELDLKYKNQPTARGGWLKIYLNDDTKEENLLTEFGSSPLPIANIKDRLVQGENKLLFVYIDSTQPNKSETKVLFTFRYKDVNIKPSITVLEPLANTVLMKDNEQNFKLRLENFALEVGSSHSNKGQIKVYFNEVKDTNRLITLRSCKDLGANSCLVEFSSKDLDFEKNIPDNKETKFIFVPTKSDGTVLDFQTEQKLVTNFNNSLNVGLPRITITEPNKNRSDQTVDQDRRFVLKIENFEILSQIGDANIEYGKGYLQIFINNEPIKSFWPSNNFSLSEIGQNQDKEGQKIITVQLVNKDFTKLKPEASDSLSVIYTPKITSQNELTNNQPQLENNSWRVIIVSLIVILVIGAIAVLVTHG